MTIFRLAPDQTIAQMWSNGARGGTATAGLSCDNVMLGFIWTVNVMCRLKVIRRQISI